MKRMFTNYPDVVSINKLMLMLNIGKKAAYSLLQAGKIKASGSVDNTESRNVLSSNIYNAADMFPWQMWYNNIRECVHAN